MIVAGSVISYVVFFFPFRSIVFWAFNHVSLFFRSLPLVSSVSSSLRNWLMSSSHLFFGLPTLSACFCFNAETWISFYCFFVFHHLSSSCEAILIASLHIIFLCFFISRNVVSSQNTGSFFFGKVQSQIVFAFSAHDHEQLVIKCHMLCLVFVPFFNQDTEMIAPLFMLVDSKFASRTQQKKKRGRSDLSPHEALDGLAQAAAALVTGAPTSSSGVGRLGDGGCCAVSRQSKAVGVEEGVPIVVRVGSDVESAGCLRSQSWACKSLRTFAR